MTTPIYKIRTAPAIRGYPQMDSSGLSLSTHLPPDDTLYFTYDELGSGNFSIVFRAFFTGAPPVVYISEPAAGLSSPAMGVHPKIYKVINQSNNIVVSDEIKNIQSINDGFTDNIEPLTFQDYDSNAYGYYVEIEMDITSVNQIVGGTHETGLNANTPGNFVRWASRVIDQNTTLESGIIIATEIPPPNTVYSLDSNFGLLAEDGKYITAENGQYIITFSTSLYNPSGSIEISGGYSLSFVFAARPSGGIVAQGYSEFALRPRLSFTATGGINIAGTVSAKITQFSYQATGEIVATSSDYFKSLMLVGNTWLNFTPRFRVFIRYIGDGSISAEEGSSSSSYILTHRSRLLLSLSNKFIGGVIRKYTATGGIVVAQGYLEFALRPRLSFTVTGAVDLSGSLTGGRTSRLKYLIKSEILNELVLQGEFDLKYLIRYSSRCALSLSNIFTGKFTRRGVSSGTVVLSGAARHKIIINYNPEFLSDGELSGDAFFNYVIKYNFLSQRSLTNTIDYKIIMTHYPEVPTMGNSAFSYVNIGSRILFNVTGSTVGSDIWGTDIYTADSKIDLISVHSGSVLDGQNKNVVVEILDGRSSYLGSNRNGITSKNWNSDTYGRSLGVQPYSVDLSGTGFRSYIYKSIGEILVEGSSIFDYVYNYLFLLVINLESNVISEYYPKYKHDANLTIQINGQGIVYSKYAFIIPDPMIIGPQNDSGFFGGCSTPAGGVSVEGSANRAITIIRTYASNIDSAIVISSSREEFTRNKFLFDSNITLNISVDNEFNRFDATYNFELSSRWFIGGNGLPNFSKDFVSRWQVNSDQYYWYRVIFCGSTSQIQSTCDAVYLQESESENHTKKLYRSVVPPEDEFISSMATKNRPSSSCLTLYQDHISNPSCGPDSMSLVTGVLARNISEVCKALKNPRIGPPPNDKCFNLLSIKKYVQPVVYGDGVPFFLPGQNELIEQEFCNLPECLEFCIDFDLSKELGQEPCNNAFEFSMTVVTNIFSHASIASLDFFGSAESLLHWHDSDGYLISISSDSLYACSNFEYVPNGQIQISRGDFVPVAPYPMTTESGDSLLLEQSIDTIDLESSLYETEDEIIDLREISFILVNNIIAQSIANLNITGETQVIAPFWSYVSDNNDIEINSDIKTLVKQFYKPSRSRINIEGLFEQYYIRKFSYEIPSLSIFDISSNFEIVRNKILYDAISKIDLLEPNTEIISARRKYEVDSQDSLIVLSSSQKLGVSIRTIALIDLEGTSDSKYTIVPTEDYLNLDIGGVSQTYSPNYSYDSLLELNAQSITEFYCNIINLGLYTFDLEAYSSISDILIESNIQDNFSDLSINNTQINVCGCLSLDLNLSLSHNLGSSGVLSQYLFRNSYTIPQMINLRYNSNKNSWFTNLNFRGRGLDSQSIEDWILMFELACTNTISGQSSNESYLRFNFFARRYNIDKNINWITNLSTSIVPSDVCQNNDLVTKIHLNTVTESIFVDDTLNPLSIVIDNIGLFKNSFWNDNVDCSVARKFNLGRGRRDGFAQCNVTGPFPEFKINYPSSPIIDYVELESPTQILL